MRSVFFLGTVFILIAGAMISFSFKSPTINSRVNVDHVLLDQSEQDWSQCVQKGSSDWGGSCLNYGFSEEKYTVHLVNSCNNDVDLMSCVQRTNDRWTCFYRMDMHQNDTLHAYACQGNGKFLKWVRKAGDVTTKLQASLINKQRHEN